MKRQLQPGGAAAAAAAARISDKRLCRTVKLSCSDNVLILSLGTQPNGQPGMEQRRLVGNTLQTMQFTLIKFFCRSFCAL